MKGIKNMLTSPMLILMFWWILWKLTSEKIPVHTFIQFWNHKNFWCSPICILRQRNKLTDSGSTWKTWASPPMSKTKKTKRTREYHFIHIRTRWLNGQWTNRIILMPTISCRSILSLGVQKPIRALSLGIKEKKD